MQSYKIALILAMLSINFDGHPKGCCGCFILQMWNAKVFGFSYKKNNLFIGGLCSFENSLAYFWRARHK